MIDQILNAKCAEDIFEAVSDVKELKKKYHEASKLCHPDIHKTERAKEAFQLLTDFYEFAQELLNCKEYGERKPLNGSDSCILAAGIKYENVELLKDSHIAKIFTANVGVDKVILKVAKCAGDNDLIFNEAAKLKSIFKVKFNDEFVKIRENVFPKLLSSFLLDGLAVNVFPFYSDYVTLEEVRKDYDIDVRTGAWIWRRMIVAMLICHEANVIHGGFTPDNFLIHTGNHNAKLIDFCYSVDAGKTATLIDDNFSSYYAPEVTLKKPMVSGTDIYMSAGIMIDLLNNQKVPIEIKRLLDSCRIKGYSRLNDANTLYKDLDEILFKVFGRRKFHEFPNKKSK